MALVAMKWNASPPEHVFLGRIPKLWTCHFLLRTMHYSCVYMIVTLAAFRSTAWSWRRDLLELLTREGCTARRLVNPLPSLPPIRWLIAEEIVFFFLHNIEQFSSYVTGTQYLPIIGNNQLLVFREMKTVYSENSMKSMNTLCARNAEFFNIKIGGTLYRVNWGCGGLFLLVSRSNIYLFPRLINFTGHRN
jgi:hypothetical protein